ncbi:MAG: hypothetical protein NUV44_05825 [Candidatus Scalindua sp.]|nr:hypothetical protein [Candidatus Scalindua sp.]
MILDKFNTFINNVENLARDPEHFLTSKYQRYRNSNGFRIELYTVRKYNSICSKFKWLKRSNLKVDGIVSEQKKRKVRTTHSFLIKHPEKTFCPYCEKSVIPRRLHKLDFTDIIIALFTGGLWAIFLFVMYLFIRRCPVCNYNLRGFKLLSDKKRR